MFPFHRPSICLTATISGAACITWDQAKSPLAASAVVGVRFDSEVTTTSELRSVSLGRNDIVSTPRSLSTDTLSTLCLEPFLAFRPNAELSGGPAATPNHPISEKAPAAGPSA